jgi:hypothetical protein
MKRWLIIFFVVDIANVVCDSMAQDDSSKQDKVQDLLEKRVDKEPWNNVAESHCCQSFKQ